MRMFCNTRLPSPLHVLSNSIGVLLTRSQSNYDKGFIYGPHPKGVLSEIILNLHWRSNWHPKKKKKNSLFPDHKINQTLVLKQVIGKCKNGQQLSRRINVTVYKHAFKKNTQTYTFTQSCSHNLHSSLYSLKTFTYVRVQKRRQLAQTNHRLMVTYIQWLPQHDPARLLLDLKVLKIRWIVGSTKCINNCSIVISIFIRCRHTQYVGTNTCILLHIFYVFLYKMRHKNWATQTTLY